MLNKLLKDLRGATAFVAVTKADHEGVIVTGTARDALDWLKESRKALADYLNDLIEAAWWGYKAGKS